jgi:hypothetical protein
MDRLTYQGKIKIFYMCIAWKAAVYRNLFCLCCHYKMLLRMAISMLSRNSQKYWIYQNCFEETVLWVFELMVQVQWTNGLVAKLSKLDGLMHLVGIHYIAHSLNLTVFSSMKSKIPWWGWSCVGNSVQIVQKISKENEAVSECVKRPWNVNS